MRIEASVRRRRPLSLTSLIDVIFLLLLFFMLSSTFTRFGEVSITGGRATASAGGPPDVLIRLTGEDWSVNGLAFGEEAAIREIGRLSEAGAQSAVLVVRGTVNSQQLVSAVERIGRETGIELSVAR
jgi:biopolymer transport protein ExbD